MQVYSQAALEIARFFANQPTPEQIIAYHPSEEANDRFYELLEAERERTLTPEKSQELEGYISIDFVISLIKVGDHRKLAQKAL